jgi:protein-tyrosine phosphatase
MTGAVRVAPAPVDACDLTFVTEQLAVGGRFATEATRVLAATHGIRHVVDLRVEACDDEAILVEHGIEFLHLPTADLSAVALPMLDDGVAFVSARVRRGERVLVHCEHGIGRSVLLTMCTLVELGFGAVEALARIKDARAKASPSPEQIEAYRAWIAPRVARVPTFDELADIAYRHLPGRAPRA